MVQGIFGSLMFTVSLK